EADLRLLSEAAWQEPTPKGDPPDPTEKIRRRPVDQLLEKYPALRKVPAGERGRLLYHKIRGDLIVGIPPGIWFGALFVLVVGVLSGTAYVMAAGSLLRRQAPWHAVLFRYFEMSFPTTVLFAFLFDASLAGYVFNIPFQIWYLPLVGLL